MSCHEHSDWKGTLTNEWLGGPQITTSYLNKYVVWFERTSEIVVEGLHEKTKSNEESYRLKVKVRSD